MLNEASASSQLPYFSRGARSSNLSYRTLTLAAVISRRFSTCVPLTPRTNPPQWHVPSVVSIPEEEHDDTMSTAPSESEDWSSSHMEDSDSHRSDAGEPSGHTDHELLHIISKVIEEFSLEWSAPAEPERSRLDEWFLQASHRHCASPLKAWPILS